MEIAEDEEEDLRAKRQSTVPEERPSTGKTIPTSDLTPTVELSDPLLGGEPSAPYLSSPEYDSFPPPREPYSPSKSIGEGRKSSQSTRPEFYNSISYGGTKPKVKLGPRPSLDVAGKSHSSGTTPYHRPVSTLPAGLKVSQKAGSKKELDRPHSLYPEGFSSMTMSPPALPETLQLPGYDGYARPRTSGGRPTSSQSMKRPPSPSASMFAKVPTITPEKSKLLKALELRKKRENAKQTSGPSLPASSPQDVVSALSPVVDERMSVMSSKVNDSGVVLDPIVRTVTDDSDATRSRSESLSLADPSEHGKSTKASSISNSTDETIQDTDMAKDSAEKELAASEDMAGAGTIIESIDVIKDTPETTSAATKRISLQKLYPTVYDPLAIYKEPEVHTSANVPAVIEEKEEIEEPSRASKVENEEAIPNVVENFEAISIPLPQDTSDPFFVTSTVSSPKHDTVASLIHEKAAETLPIDNLEQNLVSVSSPITLPVELLAPISTPIKDPASVSLVDVQKEMPLSEYLKTTVVVPLPEPSPVGSTFSVDTKRSLAEDGQGMRASSRQRRKKAHVEPIKTDITMSHRNDGDFDNFSSDDDLMEELQSAVFHDAKSITGSKSPITPVFVSPKKKKTPEKAKITRTVSSPMKREPSESKMLELPSATNNKFPPRSVSAGAAYLNRINQQSEKTLPKKVNLGSTISQRIKALERMSSLPPGAPAVTTTAPNAGASTSFFAVRKPAIRSSSQASNHTDSNLSTMRQTPSPKSSPEALKIINRTGSMKSRLDALNSNPAAAAGLTGRSRPESVSVTARIVRDPAQPFPAKPQLGKDPADYAPLNFKQSPLVIDHQKAVVDPVKETIFDRRQSRERPISSSSKTTMQERRSSVTVIRDLINDGRASFSDKRRSIQIEPTLAAPAILSPSRPPSAHRHHSPSRRLSSVSSRRNSRDLAAGFSPPPTAGSMSSTSDDRSEKKAGRTSRILRRMSNTISASRKTISHAMSPTVREESEPPALDFMSPTSSLPSQAPITPTNTSVGDVNVQFPDSLLWKRRSMMLDSAGYLILSPALTAQGKQTVAGATRKFHMSEFRTPAIPDMDMEELPNSVALDIVEGGGLQIACEDRAGQGRVLKSMFIHFLVLTLLFANSIPVLQETHRTWAAYGQ